MKIGLRQSLRQKQELPTSRSAPETARRAAADQRDAPLRPPRHNRAPPPPPPPPDPPRRAAADQRDAPLRPPDSTCAFASSYAPFAMRSSFNAEAQEPFSAARLARAA